ncbi:hypothetical protein [Trinickia acidisoli]|uniref:hypothetical protein n=1 Tax=Trinickia acidisoli TaxID=2767482 RepID=UPI002852E1D7|nr:hypothetical protein [Trinickia acidisoli]
MDNDCNNGDDERGTPEPLKRVMNGIRQIAAAFTSIAVLFGVSACVAPSAVPRPQANISAPLSIAEDGPCCGPITPEAQHVLDVLDSSNVERLWQKSTHVAWDTGEPDMSPSDEAVFARIDRRDTHCAAFAAAMGKRLGVYMLRPPRHKASFLATAQTEWFASGAGRNVGWWPVDGPEQAQALANSGRLVVVAYPSPDPHRPGHIAVVRPDDKRTLKQIRESGPEITQAGGHNYLETTVKRGFSFHPGAWPNGVKYFAHDLPDQLPPQSSD